MTRCPNCNAKVDTSFVLACNECGTAVVGDTGEAQAMIDADHAAQEASRAQPGGTTAAAPRATPPAKVPRAGRGFVTGLGIRLVLGLLIAGGIAAWQAVTGPDNPISDIVGSAGIFTRGLDEAAEIDASDLSVGDCLRLPDPETGQFSTVEGTRCDETHDAEVFAVTTYQGESWPGADAVQQRAVDACYAEFSDYVGGSYEIASDLDFNFFLPTEEGWAEHGDRVIQCLVFSADGAPLSESVRGRY